eukprot:TRINITY_DN1559_c0_g1_i1.p1 TRINITY_DN1559_c0_g1~~TRINITY_DN1559_c0_g1_i1.p1  ORF type:complete len:565 (+),score=133.33 TRINITY_DN1559_c0_g1_i1:162-1856(+)
MSGVRWDGGHGAEGEGVRSGQSVDDEARHSDTTPLLSDASGNHTWSPAEITMSAKTRKRRKRTNTGTHRRQESIALLQIPEMRVTLYKRRWAVVFLFAMNVALCAYTQYTFASIKDLVTVYYGVGSQAVNLMAVIYFATAPLIVLVYAVVNRFGLRGCVVTGCWLSILSGLIRLAGWNADLFWVMAFGQLLNAVAEKLFLTCPTLLANHWFGESERTLATTICVIFGIIGQGAIMGTNAAVQTPTQLHYILAGQCVALCSTGLLSILVVKEHPPTPPSTSAAVKIIDSTAWYDHHGGQPSHAGTPYQSEGTPGDIETRASLAQQHQQQQPQQPQQQQQQQQQQQHQKQNTDYSQLNGDTSINNNMISNTSTNDDDDALAAGQEDYDYRDTNPLRAALRDVKACFSDIYFLPLCITYAGGLSSFASLCTLINSYCKPYGYSDQIISLFGLTIILSGVVGCLTLSVVVDKTKQFRLISIISMLICSATMVWMVFALKPNNEKQLFIAFIVSGFFGMSVVPTAFQLGVEVTFPVPASVSTGLMTGIAMAAAAGLTLEIGRASCRERV